MSKLISVYVQIFPLEILTFGTIAIRPHKVGDQCDHVCIAFTNDKSHDKMMKDMACSCSTQYGI